MNPEDTNDSLTAEEEADPRLLKRLARFTIINGHPWFFRLKTKGRDTGLFGYYLADRLKYGIIIAFDVKGENHDYKKFAYFESRKDFIWHQQKYPLHERHFYEVVGAITKEQRPYFDIDIPGEKYVGDELDIIKENVFAELKSRLPPEEQVLDIDYIIFETKYPVDAESRLPKKYSYHLIINNYYFKNDEEMRAFGLAVKARIAEYPSIALIADYIDDIWHSTRQFRLMGSSKIGSESIKEYHSSFWKEEPDFEDTFVGNITGCRSVY